MKQAPLPHAPRSTNQMRTSCLPGSLAKTATFIAASSVMLAQAQAQDQVQTVSADRDGKSSRRPEHWVHVS
jgi:hypothetical protein